ncbi:MAG: DUF4038 domain-containing protein [Saprospiraceae bacterium]
MSASCSIKKAFLLVLIFINSGMQAQISVSKNHQYLQTKDGKPFFWLGDTGWELFHRLTREQAEDYIKVRASQGFNILQAVALAEFEGIRTPNRYGDFPLTNDDPTQLNITPGADPNNDLEYDYWDHVDYIIKTAARYKLYIGLLPTWGDKVAHLWGDGPILFNENNAYQYGKLLAKRYENQWNIIWILGGDRPGKYKSKDGIEYDDRPIWTAMANGIKSVLGPTTFIAYHPSGGGANATSQYLQQADWLSMNAFQSGHGSREADSWNWTKRDLAYTPLKPVLDMEPCYEDHPVNPWDGKWTRKRGYFKAYDVRARIYRGIFAGQSGVTYGHHQVWQFLDTSLFKSVNIGDTIIPWRKALESEAANELIYLKNLMLSRPYFDRVGENSLIKSDLGSTYLDRVEATGSSDQSYMMVYIPAQTPVTIDLDKISGSKKNAFYYNVTNGRSKMIKIKVSTGSYRFDPPKNVADWVLVIDDASKKFGRPGKL